MTGAALRSGDIAANTGDKGLISWFIERMKKSVEGIFLWKQGKEEKGEGGRELLKTWMGDRDFLRRDEFTWE